MEIGLSKYEACMKVAEKIVREGEYIDDVYDRVDSHPSLQPYFQSIIMGNFADQEAIEYDPQAMLEILNKVKS